MAGFILRRLLLVVTAIAFALAAALPNAVPALAMPAQMSRTHCPDKTPAGSDLGKMACGALVCAGVAIALPARHASDPQAFAKLAYAPGFPPAIIGAPPVPDPYPPRPIVLG